QLLQRRHRLAHGVFLAVVVAVAPDVEGELLAERIDHRDADAVQAAGHLVAVVVELTAGVQLGHDDLRRRDALFLVDVDGDAAAVVGHRDRTVLVDGHGDVVGVAGQGLVDRVVDHLEHHVVQAGAVVDVADVHPGPLAHGFEAAQHGDPAGIVGLGGLAAGHFGLFGHHTTGAAARRAARQTRRHISYRD